MTSKFAGLALEVEKPSRMPLLHPVSRLPLRDAAKQPAYIDLYSGDSSIARRHARAMQQRRINLRGRGKVTPEEIEADAVDFLTVLTAGWHLVALDGAQLDVTFTQENARELFSAPEMAWLREQVDEFVADRGNFSKASSAS